MVPGCAVNCYRSDCLAECMQFAAQQRVFKGSAAGVATARREPLTVKTIIQKGILKYSG